MSDWMRWGGWRPSTSGFAVWAAVASVGLWFLLREMIAGRCLSAATMVPSFALLLVGVPPWLNLLRPPATVQISASKPSIKVTLVPGLSQVLDVVQVAVEGTVAVSAPDKARQYRPFPVYRRVAPEKLADLMQGQGAHAPSKATVEGKPNVWLLPIMEASVWGQGFEVEPKDKQRYAQPVASKEPTTWSWQITPTDSGPVGLEFQAGRPPDGGWQRRADRPRSLRPVVHRGRRGQPGRLRQAQLARGAGNGRRGTGGARGCTLGMVQMATSCTSARSAAVAISPVAADGASHWRRRSVACLDHDTCSRAGTGATASISTSTGRLP